MKNQKPNIHTQKAIAMMNAAKPKSGFKPDTPEEQRNLQAALKDFSYAMYRDAGINDQEARMVANLIGGDVGEMLLRLAFKERT
jgi:hypothetical protein